MIAMGGIVIGTENSAETLARTVVDCSQKLHFLASAFPVFLYRDSAPVIENESGDINCIGMGVLRQFTRSGNIAAIVTAHSLYTFEVASQIFARRAFHGIFGPGSKFSGQFAFDGTEVGHVRSNIEQLDTINLATTAAEFAIGQRGKTDIGLAKVAKALTR